MAEAFLKSIDNDLEVYSAGVKPEMKINPNTVKVMNEEGIDISSAKPKDVRLFSADNFDYVITVCDNAKQTCPVFKGKVGNIIHIPFNDPANAKGTEAEILRVYRKVRDEIKRSFHELYLSRILKSN